MLARAARTPGRARALAAADVRALPFGDGIFDVLWCRLALGHLGEPDGAYRELARVALRGARLVVSDVHEAAIAAGHVRTFRDAAGVLQAVEHHVHGARRHERAAVAAGWALESVVDAPAGPEERPFYERAGRLDQLERERELPLVLVMRFRR
jgi:malonyl-CoA O-methyltransferase